MKLNQNNKENMKYLIILLLTLCGSIFAQDSIEKAQEGHTEALSAAQLKYNGSKAKYDSQRMELDRNES